MKKLSFILIALLVTISIISAQDTLYVYKAGVVVTKRAVNDLDSLSFTYTPPATGTVNDIDGNTYHWIKIGTQTWMVENLKVTKYRTGESISSITDNAEWVKATYGAWCNYDNDAANADKYGKLYNSYVVADPRNVAPVGWHVATDAEWTILTSFLGGVDIAGSKLIETGTTHWVSPNSFGTNESGFTALPGGCRMGDGTFAHISSYGYWWCSDKFDNSNTYDRVIGSDVPNVWRNWGKLLGFSIRCIRD